MQKFDRLCSQTLANTVDHTPRATGCGRLFSDAVSSMLLRSLTTARFSPSPPLSSPHAIPCTANRVLRLRRATGSARTTRPHASNLWTAVRQFFATWSVTSLAVVHAGLPDAPANVVLHRFSGHGGVRPVTPEWMMRPRTSSVSLASCIVWVSAPSEVPRVGGCAKRLFWRAQWPSELRHHAIGWSWSCGRVSKHDVLEVDKRDLDDWLGLGLRRIGGWPLQS